MLHFRKMVTTIFILIFCSAGIWHLWQWLKQPPSNASQPLFDPVRWEEEIQAFEREDEKSPPPKNAIVAIGSSTVRMWSSIHKDLTPLTVIARGFGGSTMNDALRYADRIVIPYQPRAIILYEGDNDTSLYHIEPGEIIKYFNEFVEKIHTSLPTTRIYVISIKPSPARWSVWEKSAQTNQSLQQICQEDSLLTYIDVTDALLNQHGRPREDLVIEDGIHLNSKGYEAWNTAIRPTLIPKESSYEVEVTPARTLNTTP